MNLYDYLQSYDAYFWKWEDDGDVIEIPNGSTIAYTPVVKEILHAMSEQGIPALGTLLVAIIATNKVNNNALNEIEDALAKHLIADKAYTAAHSEILTDAFKFLSKLSGLNHSFSSGKKRIVLFQTIFRTSHNLIVRKKAKKIVESFVTGYIDKALLQKTKPFYDGVFAQDFKPLALLNKKFASSQAILKAMANLPEEEIDLEELETDLADEPLKDFVEELIENPKTFQIGSLIKPLWAGFKIPLHAATPSQQPLGGVSDLTNKGNFDNLLISEFANDDLTFLSRLANNEALYLHREIPPAVDDRQRILLTDVSLLNWGTPKLLAIACAIAIDRHPKSVMNCKAFAVGKKYEELSLDTIEDVIDSMQITASTLNPAAGIELFIKEYKAAKRPEIFLITTPETWKQHAIQRIISEYGNLFRSIITVEGDGRISFYKLQYGNRKLLQQINLNLEKLWETKESKKELPKQGKDTIQPESEYPILLAAPQNRRKVMIAGDDEQYVIAERKLLKRISPKKGYVIVDSNITYYQKFAIGKLKNGDTVFLKFNPDKKSVTLLNLNTREQATAIFKEGNVSNQEFFFMNHDWYPEGFYYLTSDAKFCISLKGKNILIEKVEVDLIEMHKVIKDNKEKVNNINDVFLNRAILKNITNVFINSRGNLVFSNHELVLEKGFESYNYMMFSSGLNTIIASAIREGNKFTFANGSKIFIHSIGMIELESNDKTIPNIYIPSVLNTELGIASDYHFAGNEYYCPTHISRRENCSFKIIDCGSNKIEIIKILKDELDIDLHGAQKIIDTTEPVNIGHNMTKEMAARLNSKLLATGAKTSYMYLLEDNIAPIIEPNINAFHQKYLNAFIQNIIYNATSGKT